MGKEAEKVVGEKLSTPKLTDGTRPLDGLALNAAKKTRPEVAFHPKQFPECGEATSDPIVV